MLPGVPVALTPIISPHAYNNSNVGDDTGLWVSTIFVIIVSNCAAIL